MDDQLDTLMNAAQEAFERAQLDLTHLDAELESIRAEVVSEHYGSAFLEELERAAGPLGKS